MSIDTAIEHLQAQIHVSGSSTRTSSRDVLWLFSLTEDLNTLYKAKFVLNRLTDRVRLTQGQQ